MPYPFDAAPPLVLNYEDYAGFQPTDGASERAIKARTAQRYVQQLEAAAAVKPKPPTIEEVRDLLAWALQAQGDPEHATAFLLEGGPQQSTKSKRIVDQAVRWLLHEELTRMASKKPVGARK